MRNGAVRAGDKHVAFVFTKEKNLSAKQQQQVFFLGVCTRVCIFFELFHGVCS